MNIAEIAYTAGFFDGEGTITLSLTPPLKSGGVSYQLSIAISNTNLPVLLKCRDIWQVGTVKSVSVKPPRRPQWVWQVKANQAVYILKTILPYLQIKKSEAEIAIIFQEHKQHAKKVWGKYKPMAHFKREADLAELLLNERRVKVSNLDTELDNILKTNQLPFIYEEGYYERTA